MPKKAWRLLLTIVGTCLRAPSVQKYQTTTNALKDLERNTTASLQQHTEAVAELTRRQSSATTTPMWVAIAAVFAAIATFYSALLAAAIASNDLSIHSLLFTAGALLVLYCLYQGSLLWKSKVSLDNIVPIVGVGVYLFVLTVTQGVQIKTAWDDYNTANNKKAIAQAIQDENNAELSWYKAPWSLAPKGISTYLLPIIQGGARMATVLETINQYKRENHEEAALSNGALTVNSVTIASDNKHAFAKTHEIWFQPVIDRHTGRLIIPTKKHFYQIYEDTEQLYYLIKCGDNWYIESNPAPATKDLEYALAIAKVKNGRTGC